MKSPKQQSPDRYVDDLLLILFFIMQVHPGGPLYSIVEDFQYFRGYHKYSGNTMITSEGVQYCGGCAVLLGKPSVLWRVFSTAEGCN